MYSTAQHVAFQASYKGNPIFMLSMDFSPLTKFHRWKFRILTIQISYDSHHAWYGCESLIWVTLNMARGQGVFNVLCFALGTLLSTNKHKFFFLSHYSIFIPFLLHKGLYRVQKILWFWYQSWIHNTQLIFRTLMKGKNTNTRNGNHEGCKMVCWEG